MSNPNLTLVFVYNADSGLFNAVTDLAHKTFSPTTYSCNLCALTYSTFGMRREWKQFLGALGVPFEFLHADEMKTAYKIEDAPLPAMFIKENKNLRVLVDAAALNQCRTIDDLKNLVIRKLDDERINLRLF